MYYARVHTNQYYFPNEFQESLYPKLKGVYDLEDASGVIEPGTKSSYSNDIPCSHRAKHSECLMRNLIIDIIGNRSWKVFHPRY